MADPMDDILATKNEYPKVAGGTVTEGGTEMWAELQLHASKQPGVAEEYTLKATTSTDGERIESTSVEKFDSELEAIGWFNLLRQKYDLDR